MSVIALFTWILTAAFGLFLLAVWLIEYDRDYQRSAATRLPIPVISAHVLLAVTGLVVWVGYLLADSRRLAWAAAIILVVVATLGLIMAFAGLGCTENSLPPEPVSRPAQGLLSRRNATSRCRWS